MKLFSALVLVLVGYASAQAEVVWSNADIKVSDSVKKAVSQSFDDVMTKATSKSFIDCALKAKSQRMLVYKINAVGSEAMYRVGLIGFDEVTNSLTKVNMVIFNPDMYDMDQYYLDEMTCDIKKLTE